MQYFTLFEAFFEKLLLINQFFDFNSKFQLTSYYHLKCYAMFRPINFGLQLGVNSIAKVGKDGNIYEYIHTIENCKNFEKKVIPINRNEKS